MIDAIAVIRVSGTAPGLDPVIMKRTGTSRRRAGASGR